MTLPPLSVALMLLAGIQTEFGFRTPPGALQELPTRTRQGFICAVAYVHDGDTFRCTDGTRVRLSAIDTPEMPGACRPGRRCAPGSPYAAKAALEALIVGRTVRCEAVGTTYNRVAAWCSVGGVDLSCAMVRGGYAVRLPQFDRERRLCR